MLETAQSGVLQPDKSERPTTSAQIAPLSRRGLLSLDQVEVLLHRRLNRGMPCFFHVGHVQALAGSRARATVTNLSGIPVLWVEVDRMSGEVLDYD